jgi:aspartate racemase
MDKEKDVVIGIVGGMGPQAGIDLFNSILQHSDASADQEHLSTILMSMPGNIPDRTAFLEGRTNVNPAIAIADIIRRLVAAGAKVIGIACNTSHSPRIFDAVTGVSDLRNEKVKLLHMPMETCNCLEKKHPRARRIGLMMTNGTYRSGVYTHLLQGRGYDVVLPDEDFQDKVIHRMIYDHEFGLKANAGIITDEVRSLVDEALDFFRSKGTDAIILGCTDLSIMVKENVFHDISIVDSTESLAIALVKEARIRSLLYSGILDR